MTLKLNDKYLKKFIAKHEYDCIAPMVTLADKMLKELIICIVIVVSIISLDIYTQNFTEKTVHEITESFNYLNLSIMKQIKIQGIN